MYLRGVEKMEAETKRGRKMERTQSFKKQQD